VIAANLLIVIGRVPEFSPDAIGYYVRYYSEAAVFVPLALASAFAAPNTSGTRLRLPTARAGSVALVALVAYISVTLATTESISKPTSTELFSADYDNARASGRPARGYFDNLRADLAAARKSGKPFSLYDGSVPEAVLTSFVNLGAQQAGLTPYTLLSNVLPLFGEEVPYNQFGRMYVVRADGSFQRTRFVPVAGGSVTELRRAGTLRTYVEDLAPRRGQSCISARERGAALEWVPRKPLKGHNWWLRARYGTSQKQKLDLEADAGLGWVDDPTNLPAMDPLGSALVRLVVIPSRAPINAGVRLVVPPFGRLCLGSLELGYFNHEPPPPDERPDAQ
jgi:hypothetical protein